MTDLREAAQQALEALELYVPKEDYENKPVGNVMDALRAALAEPCPCGDRPADQCPGEWEPKCDLGNNPKYAKRVDLAEPVQEPDLWGAGYEAGYAAGVAEHDPQVLQQALSEADRIMGHDDEATEWRERWGHLFGVKSQRPAEPQGCNHCNHPLYAATKCRVCGRVTQPPRDHFRDATKMVQEPVATMTVREDMGADFKFSRPHTLQPGQQFYLYTAPPQRNPVGWDGRCMLGHCNSPAGCENSGECRAVERAHGIGGEE